MEYFQAFSSLLKSQGASISAKRFDLLCALSDCLDEEGNALSRAFYALSEDGPIVDLIQGKDIEEAKHLLKARINLRGKGFTRTQCIRSLEPLLCYLYPETYHPIEAIAAKVQIIRAKPVHKEERKSVLLSEKAPLQKKAAQVNKKVCKLRKGSRISGNFDELHIIYDDSPSPRLIDPNGNDIIAGQLSLTPSSYVITLNLGAGKHWLFLPKGCDRRLEGSLVGRFLEIDAEAGKRAKVDEINLDFVGGEMNLRHEGNVLRLTCCGGFARMDTNAPKVAFAGSGGDAIASLCSTRGGSYSFSLSGGDLTLALPYDAPHRPKINKRGFFRRVEYVDEVIHGHGGRFHIRAEVRGGSIKIR